MPKHDTVDHIALATAARNALVARARLDPTRPAYHYAPPAGWMNDPNGTIYYDGEYHLFYQHNPYGDAWGNLHWGHARSTNLTDWEELPIALWPSEETGEVGCWSGCCIVPPAGVPTIIYTSDPDDVRATPRTQCAATSTDGLLTWQRRTDVPVLAVETHGGPAVEGTWRDPWIFEHEGLLYMVLGATLKNESADSVVLLYEATSDDAMEWAYRGELIRHPNGGAHFFECPNMCRFGDKWVLLVSPFAPVRYYVGTLDPREARFTVEAEGRIDYSSEFYATNMFVQHPTRKVMVGWIRGFSKGRGWNGCLSLPRDLSLTSEGEVLQTPAPELRQLRGRQVSVPEFEVGETPRRFDEIGTSTCELILNVKLGDQTAVYVNSVGVTSNKLTHLVRCDSQIVDIAGIGVPRTDSLSGVLEIHLYWDNSVVEAFVEGGRASVTRVVDIDIEQRYLQVYATGKGATVSIEAWELSP